MRPIARAISSAGGIAWTEIDARFMLRKRPGVFVAGEMIDWEAPTGGYLLQGAFSTGAAAGRGAAEFLAGERVTVARLAEPGTRTGAVPGLGEAGLCETPGRESWKRRPRRGRVQGRPL